MVNSRIIHHIYIGSSVPQEMVDYMETAVELNPSWARHLWTADTIGYLGLDYGKLLEIFKKPVHVSDYVRLVAIQKIGGIYLDCDVEVIQPLDSLLCFDAFGAFQDGTEQICPAVFGAVANHPWINWQVENADHYSRPDEPWNVGLMTEAPRAGLTITPTEWFYPWLWNTPKEDRRVNPSTICIHHWKGSWAPWVIRDRT